MKKIKDVDQKNMCLDPAHNPPTHISLTPGDYEHVCPKCGKVTIVKVPLVTM